MVFLVTREDEEWGYLCKSENEESFLFCLGEMENEIMIRFVDNIRSRGSFYLIESRFKDTIRWDVSIVEDDDNLPEDILVLVKKEKQYV